MSPPARSRGRGAGCGTCGRRGRARLRDDGAVRVARHLERGVRAGRRGPGRPGAPAAAGTRATATTSPSPLGSVHSEPNRARGPRRAVLVARPGLRRPSPSPISLLRALRSRPPIPARRPTARRAYATVNGTSAAAATVAGARGAARAGAARARGRRPPQPARRLRARNRRRACDRRRGRGRRRRRGGRRGRCLVSTLSLRRLARQGWRAKQTFTVRNVSTRRIAVRVTAPGDYGTLTVRVKPARPFLLKIGQRRRITVTATGTAPTDDRAPTGTIAVTTGSRPLRIPWAIAFPRNRQPDPARDDRPGDVPPVRPRAGRPADPGGRRARAGRRRDHAALAPRRAALLQRRRLRRRAGPAARPAARARTRSASPAAARPARARAPGGYELRIVALAECRPARRAGHRSPSGSSRVGSRWLGHASASARKPFGSRSSSSGRRRRLRHRRRPRRDPRRLQEVGRGLDPDDDGRRPRARASPAGASRTTSRAGRRRAASATTRPSRSTRSRRWRCG